MLQLLHCILQLFMFTGLCLANAAERPTVLGMLVFFKLDSLCSRYAMQGSKLRLAMSFLPPETTLGQEAFPSSKR